MLKITKPCSVLLKPIESSAKMGKLLIQFEERTGEYMEYMSAPQAAEKRGISERRVQILCSKNRIPGVSKLGYMWLIPKDAEKPADARRKEQKMNTHKILLVEDDAEISEMLTNYLSMENYEVACAADGQDACNLFDNDTFSIVLLDLMIPKISGMEVMQYIRDCGYANTDGVVLYVGVNDDGCVVGIEGSNY